MKPIAAVSGEDGSGFASRKPAVMEEEREKWHPEHDVEEGTGPSGDLETEEGRTDPEPGAEQPVPGDGGGAAGGGGPSPSGAADDGRAASTRPRRKNASRAGSRQIGGGERG